MKAVVRGPLVVGMALLSARPTVGDPPRSGIDLPEWKLSEGDLLDVGFGDLDHFLQPTKWKTSTFEFENLNVLTEHNKNTTGNDLYILMLVDSYPMTINRCLTYYNTCIVCFAE